MSRYRVTCIMRDPESPGCLVEAVGFAGQIYAIDEAVCWLSQSPDNQLWVVDDRGKSVWVSARQHQRTGRYFLTTEREGRPLNELESLPECRADGSCGIFRFGMEPRRDKVAC